MRKNITMPGQLRPFYQKELNDHRIAFDEKRFQVSWRHLERAHILSQPYALQHTSVHWHMIMFGVRTKNWKEVIGQLPRLFFGGVKSFVGRVPIGNTGGANVPSLKPMEIPEDLDLIIKSNTN